MPLRRLRYLFLALLLCALTGTPSRALQITGASLDPSPFSPNLIRDGFKDTTFVYFTLSDPATSVNLAITAPVAGGGAGSVTLVHPGPFAAGSYRFPWDGTLPGSLVTDGDFTVQISAYGPGGADSVTRVGTIDVTPPGISFLRIQPSALVYCDRTPGVAIRDSALITVGVRNFNTTTNPRDILRVWVERTYTSLPTFGGDRNDTLPVNLDRLRSDDTLTLLWKPAADTGLLVDGVRTVHVEAYDFSGNRTVQSGTVDMDLTGVHLVATVPPGGFLGGKQRVRTPLNYLPDTLRGYVANRHRISDIHARFGGRDPQPVTLYTREDSTFWSVPMDKGAVARGWLEAEIFAQDENGCVEHDSIRILYDTIPPPALTLYSALPTRTHRGRLVVGGTADTSDSLVGRITYPDGSFLQTTRPLQTQANPNAAWVFADTFALQPGDNKILLRGKDLAGNLGPASSETVNYDVTSGIGAPQVFHAGDAFRARLDQAIASLSVRIYRPDGGFVRELFSDLALDISRHDIETVWDLKNGNGALVGRGPHICVLNVKFFDGSTTSRRLAVIAAP